MNAGNIPFRHQQTATAYESTSLPVASTILTHDGLLGAVAAPLRTGELAVIAAYIRDDGQRHVWGEWHEFGGGRWQRVLNLSWDLYTAAVGPACPWAVSSPWSRLPAIHPDRVSAAVSARSPLLPTAHLEPLSGFLHVPGTSLGLYGSTLYKPPDRTGDCDFVVYGADNSRRAWRHILTARGHDQSPLKHHQHFRIPGSQAVYDPRFVDDDTTTDDLMCGQALLQGVQSLDARVTDDADGIFLPARYALDDGTTLVSWRLGHAGLLRPGDRIGHPGLPVVRIGDRVMRLVLRWESLDINANADRDQMRPQKDC